MRFQGLDLNLLVALDLLIEHRSVTQAALAMHISQSALSSGLARLRLFFEDELLVSNGRGMVLTPKAEELAPAVRDTLMRIQANITNPAGFDPATSRREFSIIASDYVLAVLLQPMMRDTAQSAPNLRYRVLPVSDATTEQFLRGHVDVAILTDVVLSPHHPSRPLFQDEFKGICCAENPEIGASLTMEQVTGLGHAATSLSNMEGPGSIVDVLLQQKNIPRSVEVIVPTFAALAGAVIGTRRIAMVHGRLAAQFAAQSPIRVVEIPFDLPPIREHAQWHSLRQRDTGVEWLVQELARHGGALDEASRNRSARVPV